MGRGWLSSDECKTCHISKEEERSLEKMAFKLKTPGELDFVRWW